MSLSIRQYSFPVLLLLLIVAAYSIAGSDKQKGEWEALFDGSTLDNFRGYCKEGVPPIWSIDNGTLHVRGVGKMGTPEGGDLITKKQYGNFVLMLEWKIAEGGNSGIFYLGQEKCGNGGTKQEPIYVTAPEMQVLDNERHPDAKLGKDGNRQAGSLYDLIPARPQNTKPAGQWNKVKIKVNNGEVTHWLNGEKVVEYTLWSDDWKKMTSNSKFKDWPDFVNTSKEGYIGLQDHGDNVWFRNIKIKELK